MARYAITITDIDDNSHTIAFDATDHEDAKDRADTNIRKRFAKPGHIMDIATIWSLWACLGSLNGCCKRFYVKTSDMDRGVYKQYTALLQAL